MKLKLIYIRAAVILLPLAELDFAWISYLNLLISQLHNC